MPRAEERLEQLSNDLDDYARSLGFPGKLPAEVESEVARLLALTPGQLSRLSAIECSEGAFLLCRFATHLQNALNREQARLRWAEECIRKIIAPHLAQQKGYSFEERKLLAVRDNDAASNIDTLRVKAQLRIERVSYLSNKVENMARSLMALAQSKRGS